MRRIASAIRAGVLLIVVMAMLALNVATLAIGSLNAMASAAIEAVSGIDPVAHRDRRAVRAAEAERAEARRQVATAQEESRRLLQERDRAAVEARTIRADRDRLARRLEVSERRVAAAASEAEQLREIASDLVTFRGRRMAARDAVLEVSRSVRGRTTRVATANLGSMVGESIPFYGIAIIVAATSFELGSACQSMQDMHDLEVSPGAGDGSNEQVSEVCGLEVPSTEEVWQAIRSSPAQAWNAASAALSGLGDVDLPSPDFGGMWARTVEWFGGWFADEEPEVVPR